MIGWTRSTIKSVARNYLLANRTELRLVLIPCPETVLSIADNLLRYYTGRSIEAYATDRSPYLHPLNTVTAILESAHDLSIVELAGAMAFPSEDDKPRQPSTLFRSLLWHSATCPSGKTVWESACVTCRNLFDEWTIERQRQLDSIRNAPGA